MNYLNFILLSSHEESVSINVSEDSDQLDPQTKIDHELIIRIVGMGNVSYAIVVEYSCQYNPPLKKTALNIFLPITFTIRIDTDQNHTLSEACKSLARTTMMRGGELIQEAYQNKFKKSLPWMSATGNYVDSVVNSAIEKKL